MPGPDPAGEAGGRCAGAEAGVGGDTDAAAVLASLHRPERFARLFDRHAPEIHRYLARRVGATVADDLVAQTFLVAFERRAAFDTSREDARPWLFGIATRLLRRYHRDEVRAYRALARTGVDPVAGCHADRVVTRVDAGVSVSRLGGALGEMAGGDRDVLLLFAWADLGYVEIAHALDIPVGTVRSRLHRARARLRGVLAEAAGPPDPEETR